MRSSCDSPTGGAEAVDVARHDMAAEPVVRAQRLLEIDVARLREPDRAVQAFARHVDVEARVGLGDHGHAGALDRDAVAERDVREVEAAGVHGQPHAGVRRRAERIDRFDAADCRDNSGKHRDDSVQ